MEKRTTLITGKQGTVKNKRADKIVGERSSITTTLKLFNAALRTAAETNTEVIIIDEVNKSNLPRIKQLISQTTYHYRAPFARKTETKTMPELIILSNDPDVCNLAIELRNLNVINL